MDSDFDFQFGSNLEADFFFALEADFGSVFGFDFAFEVGLEADGVVLSVLLSSCCLDIFS